MDHDISRDAKPMMSVNIHSGLCNDKVSGHRRPASPSSHCSSPHTQQSRENTGGLTLVLINADTGFDAGPLTDGQQILNPSVGFGVFMIRTDLEPVTTASIGFVLSGPVNEIRVESAAPYPLFGDSIGVAAGMPLVLGSYVLVVESFSHINAGGQ